MSTGPFSRTPLVPFDTFEFNTKGEHGLTKVQGFLGNLMLSILALNSPCNALEIYTTYEIQDDKKGPTEIHLPNVVLFLEKALNLKPNQTIYNCCADVLSKILSPAQARNEIRIERRDIGVPAKIILTYRMVTIASFYPRPQNGALHNQLPVGIILPNRHSRRYGWRPHPEGHAVAAIQNLEDYVFLWNERCIRVPATHSGIPYDISFIGNMGPYVGHPIECMSQWEE